MVKFRGIPQLGDCVAHCNGSSPIVLLCNPLGCGLTARTHGRCSQKRICELFQFLTNFTFLNAGWLALQISAIDRPGVATEADLRGLLKPTAFQAGYVGSIPIARSKLAPRKLPCDDS